MHRPHRQQLVGPLLASLALLTACQDWSDRVNEGRNLPCTDCNVLLISLDTLRADHMSVYGYSRATTPFLEELAREAVVFDDMVNNGGGTLPVHISMMTSLPLGVHDVTPRSKRILEEERVTLAEQLVERGIRTAAFTDRGWVRARFGFGQGFELFDEEGGRFAMILPKARNWLTQIRPSQFFLFLHTYDTHSEWREQPYECPGDFPDLYTADLESDFTGCLGDKCASQLLLWFNQQIRSQSDGFRLEDYLDDEDLRLIEARYDGCINYVDEELRQFFDWLRQEGLYDNTLIIITSDHGEEFLEHGRLLHQNMPFEELVRIPLIVKFPESAFGGTRVPHLATTIDLMPTVLEVLGIEPDPQVMGISLMATLAEQRPVRRSASIGSAIRTRRWKFIPVRSGHFLYNLEADPHESLNVRTEHPELVERFGAESKRVTEEHKRLRKAFQNGIEEQEELELTPEEIENLKALGYLQ